MGIILLVTVTVIMESKLLVLIFLGSDFFVDIENENPLSRTLCCLTANAQSKCATNCANQDCAATRTVRCGILSSVCATYTCSGVTTSCTTSTSTTAATTTTACAAGSLAGGAACIDSSSVSLGTCCAGYTCAPFPGNTAAQGFCTANA